jgi:hypothetical protein
MLHATADDHIRPRPACVRAHTYAARRHLLCAALFRVAVLA